MENIDFLRERLLAGQVIPAHPLALTAERKLDVRRQRALTRYYLDSGAGGVAVGVHTTQFAIRDKRHQLFQPVLELACDVARERSAAEDTTKDRKILIAGVCGRTEQALGEAAVAHELGYDAVLLSLAALEDANEDELIQHCEEVARCLPIIGFYLQPAVGGRRLSYDFWLRFCQIDNVAAIKVAPFNRYQTIDVVRAVYDTRRQQSIALYTGNDDAILFDLLSQYTFDGVGEPIRFSGGLLGHWACWTSVAVRLLQRVRNLGFATNDNRSSELQDLYRLAHQVTDMNAAIFDAANGFAGCIAGIHEVLRRQGLLQGVWCLDSSETLSPGQSDEIARVCQMYPHLVDDRFVAEHLNEWLQ